MYHIVQNNYRTVWKNKICQMLKRDTYLSINHSYTIHCFKQRLSVNRRTINYCIIQVTKGFVVTITLLVTQRK